MNRSLERAVERHVDSSRMEEDAMCHSRYWSSEDERRMQAAKANEADEKRAGTIRSMLSEAEKKAEEAKAREAERQAAPAK